MRSLTIHGWNIGFDKVSFTNLLRETFAYGLAEAKHLTDAVLDDRPVELHIQDADFESFALKAGRLGARIAAQRPTYAPGSLLTVANLPLSEIASILTLTTHLESLPPEEKSTLLKNRRIALLFYESSTRTRTSFELAAKSLGATTTLVSDKSSSIEKGESLKDTGLTLRALGAEAIILRHKAGGAPFLLARMTGLPVLNAGDGMHQHPSQALLDLRTLLQRLHLQDRPIGSDTLAGKTIVITGDILHSRVAKSNAMLLPRLGARVILCGPPALLPEEALTLAPGVEIARDFDEALKEADAIMMLRIQRERLAGLEIDLNEYIARYQLDQHGLAACKPSIVVLHPGPMIRGLEIAGEVADSPASAIEQQVANGLAVRAALLVRALSPPA